MTFVSLVLIQFFNAYNCRSDRLSVFRRPFANRWLNIAIVVGDAAACSPSSTCRSFSGRSARSVCPPSDWALTTALAFTVVPVLEGLKWMARRGWFGELV